LRPEFAGPFLVEDIREVRLEEHTSVIALVALVAVVIFMYLLRNDRSNKFSFALVYDHDRRTSLF
jgi:hypothetical protein